MSARKDCRRGAVDLIQIPRIHMPIKDLLRIGLRRLPPTEFIHIRGLETELGDYDGAAELELGLDLLLTGIDHTLNTPPS